MSVVIPDASRASGFNSGVFSIFFTTQTTLLQTAPQNTVTLSFPAGFFASATNPVINGQSPADSFVNPVFKLDGVRVVGIVLRVNQRRPPTAFNVTLDGLTMGVSQSTCISNVFVQSSTDRRSTNAVSAGAFNSFHVSRGLHILRQAVSGAKYGTWR